MKLTKSPRLQLVFGVLFLSVGLFAGYWWFYKLAPLRDLVSSRWQHKYIDRINWEREKENYQRLGMSPDLCFNGDRIGYFGDKEWFLWLEGRMRNPEDFRVCGCTHHALSLMTNQDAESWREWTDANRSKSQEEWIREGFSKYGVTVQLPPSDDDTFPLLRLLGRKSWNALFGGSERPDDPKFATAVPNYIIYNAFRWLRDSGFEIDEFMEANPNAITDREIGAGLLRYTRWEAESPRHSPGTLTFAKHGAVTGLPPPAPVLQAKVIRLGIPLLIVLFAVQGIALLRRFAKHLRA